VSVFAFKFFSVVPTAEASFQKASESTVKRPRF